MSENMCPVLASLNTHTHTVLPSAGLLLTALCAEGEYGQKPASWEGVCVCVCAGEVWVMEVGVKRQLEKEKGNTGETFCCIAVARRVHMTHTCTLEKLQSVNFGSCCIEMLALN